MVYLSRGSICIKIQVSKKPILFSGVLQNRTPKFLLFQVGYFHAITRVYFSVAVAQRSYITSERFIHEMFHNLLCERNVGIRRTANAEFVKGAQQIVLFALFALCQNNLNRFMLLNKGSPLLFTVFLAVLSTIGPETAKLNKICLGFFIF